MAIQRQLGSDIAMVFDECTAWPATWDEANRSLDLTLRWAAVSREQPAAPGQLRFGIVQGSTFPDLREKATRAIIDLDFDGIALGGVSVGEPEREMVKVLNLRTAVAACPAPLSDGRWHAAPADPRRPARH